MTKASLLRHSRTHRTHVEDQPRLVVLTRPKPMAKWRGPTPEQVAGSLVEHGAVLISLEDTQYDLSINATIYVTAKVVKSLEQEGWRVVSSTAWIGPKPPRAVPGKQNARAFDGRNGWGG